MFDPHKVLLKCNYLDTALAIAFWLPGIKADGSTGYPEENRFNAIIRQEPAAALLSIAQGKLIDAIEERREYEGGVFINKDRTSILQFVVQIPNTENAIPVVKLVYMSGIDMDKKPKNTYVYEFATSGVVENFVPGSESHEISITDVQAQVWLFCEYLKSYISGLTNANTHSYRLVQNWANDRIYKTIEQIAVKVGVPIQTYTPNRNGTASTEVVAAPSAEVPVEIVESLEALPF